MTNDRCACLTIDVRMADAPGIGTYLRNLVPRIISARPTWRFVLLGSRSAIDGLGWAALGNVSVRPLDASIYSARERAALGWIEAVTLVAQGHVPDDVFEAVRQGFSEKEIVDLTAAAIAINSWNRIAIAFGVPPQVESKKAAA